MGGDVPDDPGIAKLADELATPPLASPNTSKGWPKRRPTSRRPSNTSGRPPVSAASCPWSPVLTSAWLSRTNGAHARPWTGSLFSSRPDRIRPHPMDEEKAMPASNGLISLREFCEDPANHEPRSSPAAAPAHSLTADTSAPSVFDPETGRERVMSDKCRTCIGRRGNPAGLSAERRRDLLGRCPDGSYDEGWTVCHATLPDNPDNTAGLPPSVCAWVAQHPQAAARSLAMRIGAAQGIDYIAPEVKG